MYLYRTCTRTRFTHSGLDSADKFRLFLETWAVRIVLMVFMDVLLLFLFLFLFLSSRMAVI